MSTANRELENRPAGKVLSIVIPALNEQDAIASTLERCLEARAQIVERAGLAAVEILVVSDGSTDRTESIALGFPEITVLAFERNRGYGAAIKAGFAAARGDLLGFIDADGTCEPRFFADLCLGLDANDAQVALGSRMGATSRMPAIRRVGNALFAAMLGLLSKRFVRDSASGMRVVRRGALPDLYPLPDGLHFTPAMSARVLLEGKLKLVELPMPYAERVGRSKLSVIRDGLRFFDTITRAALCFRPSRVILLAALACALAALGVGLLPLGFYLSRGRLEEWMIYRVLLASLLTTGVAILACAGAVADRIAAVAFDRRGRSGGATGVLLRVLSPRMVVAEIFALAAGAVAVVWPGIREYSRTSHVEMHWSRAVLGSLLLSLVLTLLSTVFLLALADLIRARRYPTDESKPADRVRPAEIGPGGIEGDPGFVV